MLCLLFVCALQLDRNVVVSNDWNVEGSGVVIETGLVLTNYHLLGDTTYVNNALATVVKSDQKLDLALLKVKTVHEGRVRFASARKGEAVYYVGNPGPHTGAVSRGYIVDLDKDHLATDTLPIPGMSGGGLYDKHGRLVGLNEGYQLDETVGVHIAIHISSSVIRKFLEGT